MGYGTYSDDYDNTGGTILVSGPLTSDKDYEDYVKEILAENPEITVSRADNGFWNYSISGAVVDGENDGPSEYHSLFSALEAACDALDISFETQEVFNQRIYDDFNEHLVSTIEEAGEGLGLDVVDRSGFRSQKSNFDTEFMSIMEGRFIGAGWRSWQHDFVIGVGAALGDWRGYISKPDDHAIDILSRTGRSPSDFVSKYETLASDMQEYLRLSMQKVGIECSFRTSGYTSQKYDTPDDIDAQLNRLKELITSNYAALNASPQSVIAAMGADDRVAIIKAIDNVPEDEKYYSEKQVCLSVPVFDHIENAVLWVNPSSRTILASSNASEGGFNIQAALTHEDLFEGLSIIPRNELTKDWFSLRQQKVNEFSQAKTIIASAEEYSDASRNDFVVKFSRLDASVEKTLSRALNLLQGANVDLDELLTTGALLATKLENLNDSHSQAMKAGLAAVASIPKGDISEAKFQLSRAIRQALEHPENDDAPELEMATPSKMGSLLRPR